MNLYEDHPELEVIDEEVGEAGCLLLGQPQ